ncbi:MAG: hypothetical protein OXN27_14025 [Candidatus Poribacteria bacterium]|nr:hypothetical protein [Candidatus Poribacteria bacterium]MDE0325028.1 hypothetical protein [Candidatus Poribacteria bacterium]
MAITYDFIVYSSRTSAMNWILGMKAIQGEVPLDIVIPNEQTSSDPENPEIVGVLTNEGLERESTDGLELYWYLRQLNPKKNETFGYNEVAIRNIHNMLSNLRVNEEIRVQITYNERKEPYPQFSYHIKLIGIFPSQDAAGTTHKPDEIPDEIATSSPPASPEKNTQPQEQKDRGQPEQTIYKTTNTLEKLITFTQNLQKELTQTQQELAVMVDKVQRLEDEQQQFNAVQDLIQDILDQLTRLEGFNARIKGLEAGQEQFQDLQESLQKFLTALNQQTQTLLHEQKK